MTDTARPLGFPAAYARLRELPPDTDPRDALAGINAGRLLTGKAAHLIRAADRTWTEGRAWPAALAHARRTVTAMIDDPADRHLNTATTAALLRVVATDHPRGATDQRTDIPPPLFDDHDGHPIALLGHVLAELGVTARQVTPHVGLWAADVLNRLGWRPTTGARAVIEAAQHRETKGIPWRVIVADLAATRPNGERS